MAKDTKEHIMEVAFLLFLQKSYKAVTIKDIVTGSGVSKGAFYHYFESKNSLFVEMFKSFYSDALQKSYDSINNTTLKDFYIESLNQSYAMFKKLRKKSAKKSVGKANHFLLLFEAAHRNPEFRKIVIKEGQREINIWKEAVENAQHTGEITDKISAKAIAKMFIFIGDGHGMNNSLNKESGQFDMAETRRLYDSLYDLLKQ